MTRATAPTPGKQSWYVRPAVVLPVVSALIILSALVAPNDSAGRTGDARLTTYSTQAQGASAVYELSRRLGWTVQRRVSPDIDTAPDIIHAVLAPVVPLRAADAHALLEHVRHGGAMLLVLDENKSELGDSLHIKLGTRGGGYVPERPMDRRAECAPEKGVAKYVSLWPDNRAHLYSLMWTTATPPLFQTLLSLDATPFASSPASELPAVIGMSLGAGRVVIASDPDFLRNDALRVCRFGLDVAAVRALEFLRDGGAAPRRRIVFDEYHQRNSARPGTMTTVFSFLSRTTSGHVLFQLLGAGVVLLLAMAPRAIPPRNRDRIERRSPLEHVDALARAYAQVGGTRTASALLVRGLRRRVERGTARVSDTHTDERFLDRLLETNPGLHDDVAMVRKGLKDQLTAQDFALLGAAVQRIELSLARL